MAWLRFADVFVSRYDFETIAASPPRHDCIHIAGATIPPAHFKLPRECRYMPISASSPAFDLVVDADFGRLLSYEILFSANLNAGDVTMRPADVRAHTRISFLKI